MVASHHIEPALVDLSFNGTLCQGQERAYLSIIITVLPLWAILTTLIVFVLLAFHRNLRATKIYDNCTKQTAQFVYHIELRTGDTSSTYNKRRTTITIDMFDDSQTTLARIAIPGHVIFGRKESPIGTLDDDKYFELRVTRLWLYRATKLKKVSTIRLTHSCLEQDARIMVYGVEIRTNESDKHKMFFPIMNYITAYGCQTKPCFDLDPVASIDAMGHVSAESSATSEHLSLVDYTLLVLLLAGLIFFMSTYEILSDSFAQPQAAAYKGGLVGLLCFVAVFLYGLFVRYVIKRRYSQAIGTGPWGISYYVNCTLMLVVATGLWIATTIISYRSICPTMYSFWLMSISVALVCSVALIVISSILGWTVQMVSPKQLEQYILPDELSPHYQAGLKSSQSKGAQLSSSPTKHASAGAHVQSHPPPPPPPPPQSSQPSSPSPGGAHSPPSWPLAAHAGHHAPVPLHYGLPHGGFAAPAASQPMNIYSQPVLYNHPMMTPTGTAYKNYQPNAFPSYETTGQYYTQQAAVPQPPPPPLAPAPAPPPPAQPPAGSHPQPSASIPQQQQQQQPQHHHQQQQQARHSSPPASNSANYQQQTGVKPFKKIGSNESTGSNYYQQLMKNKGGVKSISQYGELLRQKKAPKK